MNRLIKVILKLLSPRYHAKYCGVKIGENSQWFTRYVPTEAYLVTVGSNTQITEGVMIFTHGGCQVARSKFPKFDVFGKVEIGDWTYIGSNSLIMPGVSIGNHCLIAAGSVVTKSIPSNSVAVGNPARVISDLDSYIEKNLPFNLNTAGMSKGKKERVLLHLEESMFIKK